MLNLCLPMKVINITQHSGGSYSHPNMSLDLAGSDAGIDFAFAMGDYWRCISGPFGSNTYFFTACDAKGKEVEVFCADGVSRVVTIALTHANFDYVAPPTLGKIYKNGEPIYEEGTKGHATGNHIHLEVAQGLQYTKHYDDNLGVWRMYSELKPENVFFICDSFSVVANMGGTVIRHCETVMHDKPAIVLPDGFSKHMFRNATISVYKMSGRERIGIVSCEYGKACDMLDVGIPGKKIKCVVNANYFMMGSGDGYLGRVQGYKNNSLNKIDARPASPYESGVKADKPYMDLVYTKTGNIVVDDLFSWDYPIDEVFFGTSPAGVEIDKGIAVNKYSPDVGYGKIVNNNTQTMLIRCKDGKFALAIADYLAPIPDLQDWGLEYSFDHLSCYDSGGSTQMIVDDHIIRYTERKCPVWFVIFEDDDDKSYPEEAIGTIHCSRSALRIRDGYLGAIKSTIPKGEDCELLAFLNGIQGDGYQWALTRKGGVSGYSQIDTAVLWIELFDKGGGSDETE